MGALPPGFAGFHAVWKPELLRAARFATLLFWSQLICLKYTTNWSKCQINSPGGVGRQIL